MNAEKADNQKYAEDKPADCTFCYFWNAKKKVCTQLECYYLIAKIPEKESEGQGYDCRGCPYGRHSPCIGFCLSKIIREMKLRI